MSNENRPLVFIDLTKKVISSGIGKKFQSLGFTPAGHYFMENADYGIKVKIPILVPRDRSQATLFHAVNPFMIVALINQHPNYKTFVASTQEAKNLVDTVTGIDFSNGFEMSTIMGALLPMVTNKAGLKFRLELTVTETFLDKDFEEVAIEIADSNEDLVVETSVLGKDLLSHPKVSRLVGSLIPGLGGSAASNFFK